MIKTGWSYTKEDWPGGYEGSYKTYEVVSPSGNVYKLHNNCNKYPHFFMMTDDPSRYTKSVGFSFNEVMQAIYQLEEEEGVFKPAKEIYNEQLYVHKFSINGGYSCAKVNMDKPFPKTRELLHPYDVPSGYIVFSKNSENDFSDAKNTLKKAINDDYRESMVKQINNIQKNVNILDSKISKMFDITNTELEDDMEII